ncbi:shikimate kinase [Sediminibacillus halophilus]|uniref:Shikimate kinase n=1 Tax=Sediminibacillus halophilus TaxID=482461 RepID=A0A1G9YE83_9BACI|nr:shikimate kinase [Sediminibacillus halophilus]SDN07469.1 shikimate kinase [Sediminibacillus halophilus]
MKAIYLIGFMGSGKSSVLRLLAEKMALPGLDTDQQIEQTTGRTIPEIFKCQGEAIFREKETDTLMKMPKTDAVVATGGGIVESTMNRNWLKEHVFVVYLHTSLAEIDRRLGNDDSRPLWKKHEKTELYERRLEKYRQTADNLIETDGKSPEQVAEEIYQLIRKENTDMLGI